MFHGDRRHVPRDASAAARPDTRDDESDPLGDHGEAYRSCDEHSCGQRCAYRPRSPGLGGGRECKESSEAANSAEEQQDDEEDKRDDEEVAVAVETEDDDEEEENEEVAYVVPPSGPLNAIAAAIPIDWLPCPENACVACDRFRCRCGPAEDETFDDECVSCSQNFKIVMGNMDDGDSTPAPVTDAEAATVVEAVTTAEVVTAAKATTVVESATAADQRRKSVTRKRKTATLAKTNRNPKNKKK